MQWVVRQCVLTLNIHLIITYFIICIPIVKTIIHVITHIFILMLVLELLILQVLTIICARIINIIPILIRHP